MPSTPIAGSVNNGNGEKIFKPVASSGFFNSDAIGPERTNNVTENTAPSKRNSLLIAEIKVFCCPIVSYIHTGSAYMSHIPFYQNTWKE